MGGQVRQHEVQRACCGAIGGHSVQWRKRCYSAVVQPTSAFSSEGSAQRLLYKQDHQ